MTFGINIANAVGTIVFNSDTIGGVYVETLSVAYGNTGSKTYTDYPGRTLRIFQLSTYGCHTFTTSVDGSGYPVFSWTAFTTTKVHSASSFHIFAV